MGVSVAYVPNHLFLKDKNLCRSLLPGTNLKWNPKSFRVQCSPSRPSTNHYQPTIWNYDFLESLKKDQPLDEINEERAITKKLLEEEVRGMIENEGGSPLELLELIDDIERLGLGYCFEKEISEALNRLVWTSKALEDINVGVEKSLHATSLTFRLLRQHGYEVIQDVFKSFKDHKYGFKESLQKDVKGMVSLYEASFLAFEDETLLEEAKSFTRAHLKNQKGVTISLAKEVNHAIEMPLHHRMSRLEARGFIDAYSEKENANQSLLQLAILDFNEVQSTLQQDLQVVSRWWKCIGLANNVNFIRDRLTECFFWTVGIVFEPQHSNCRIGLTKVTSLITTIDDIYDVYGSLDELELFTDAVKRWDVNVVKDLPDYMKLYFLALYNTVNEMAYDTLKLQGHNTIPILTKVWGDLCEAFLLEAKWSNRKHIPTLEDYLENAWRSVSGVVILVHAYFLMEQPITNEAMEGLERYHDLLKWSSIIFRLCNDLGTSSAELERGKTANSIVCYMRESGVSEELAREHISKLIEEAWSKMNKYLVSDNSPFSKTFIQTAINLARISHCTYQYGDGHGAPDTRSKKRILSLIIEPVTIVGQ